MYECSWQIGFKSHTIISEICVMAGNLPWIKTRFQNILATCVPPRNTKLDRMSMAVEKAEKAAKQRLSFAAEIFRSWEISKKKKKKLYMDAGESHKDFVQWSSKWNTAGRRY